MGLFGNDKNQPLENADINCSPQNEFVTKDNVSKLDHLVDEGEKVHFLAKGTEGIDIEAPDGDLEGGSGKSILTAATDHRVVCRIWKLTTRDQEISIPYHSISTINYKSGVLLKKMHIQTNSKTYAIGISSIPEDERDRMVQFIRDKVTEINQPTNAEQTSSDDPLDKLERLRDLKEDGVVSEEEFNEKKKDLLDQI